MQELTLMQKFADPQLIDKLTAGERTLGSLVTMLMGMGITFIVLLILWGCIALLTKILDKKEQKHEASEKILEAAVERAVASNKIPEPAAAMASAEDESELIAVITAAIAASTGHPASNLVISKIRRIKGNMTTWGQAGGSESIESRRF